MNAMLFNDDTPETVGIMKHFYRLSNEVITKHSHDRYLIKYPADYQMQRAATDIEQYPRYLTAAEASEDTGIPASEITLAAMTGAECRGWKFRWIEGRKPAVGGGY